MIVLYMQASLATVQWWTPVEIYLTVNGEATRLVPGYVRHLPKKVFEVLIFEMAVNTFLKN